MRVMLFEVWQSQCAFLRVLFLAVLYLAVLKDVMSEEFHSFPQSFHANANIAPQTEWYAVLSASFLVDCSLFVPVVDAV
jgi:hypothetical protein